MPDAPDPIQEAVAWLREMADVHHEVSDAERWLSWADAIEAREREINRLQNANIHQRHALLLLQAMMRMHSVDEFGYEPERTGCYDIVCRGIDGTALPSTSGFIAEPTESAPYLPAAAPPLGSPAPSRDERMIAALKAARELIAGLRESDFECFTVCGDPETMDNGERAVIAEYDVVLAQVDEVMNG